MKRRTSKGKISKQSIESQELTDEEMALPGTKPTNEQLEKWLAKDDGKKYEINEAFRIIKMRLSEAGLTPKES